MGLEKCNSLYADIVLYRIQHGMLFAKTSAIELITFHTKGKKMKATTILSLTICSLFLTAQAAVDAGKSAQAKKQNPMQMQQRLHVPKVTDLQLMEMVQQQLRSSVKNYNPNKYTISSQNGEVTLQGNVATRAEAEQMEKEVLRVQGVNRVHNNLVIKSE